MRPPGNRAAVLVLFRSAELNGSLPAMRALLLLLAVLGVLALLRRMAGALFLLLGRAAEGVVARQSLEARAQRGDLTGVAEASAWRQQSRRRRRLALLTSGAWAALLVAPVFTSWTLVIYSACSLLWVLPPIRRRADLVT